MANTIQIKRSTGSSSPTGLSTGELAWIDAGSGGANGKLFIGDAADGSARHIGGRGTGAIGGGAASSLAADDLTAGDAAVTLSTSSGNITIDATASDSDIIFKGTDDSSDITMLTLDGSEAGAATFNNKVVATELDISGNADIDGTMEADAYTVDGTALAEYIADTAGAMFTSNTETGITATYQDADNTVDLVVGTLNQDTTGLAATATALATARNINGTSFDGTANITITAAGSTLSDTVTVAKGGTGATSLTDGGILLGSGTSAVTATAALGNGELLIGDGTTDPTVATLTAGSNITISNGSGSISIAGTANDNDDVSVANLKTRLAGGFGSNAVTIGDSDDVVTIGNDLTVTGDLVVSGDTTTVNTATMSVEDPLIILASGNSADSVDVGFYAKYVESSTTKYAGLFRDASASGNPWVFFDGNQAAPSTTVNTGGTGYDLADISAGAITSADGFTGALTGNASTATALATARTIGGVSFDGTANISLVSGSIPDNAADTSGNAGTATTLATARNINGVSFDGSANITVTAAGSTLSDTVTVAKGGTGATSLTDGGILLGSGTGAVTAMAVLSDGEMIVGDGTTDPVAESGATLRTSIGCGPTAGNTSLVTLGTITTGTWTGTAIASAYLDADTAHLTTAQTFTGAKTFTANVVHGVDGTGVDVKYFGDTSSAYMLWDQSADNLVFSGGASIDGLTLDGGTF